MSEDAKKTALASAIEARGRAINARATAAAHAIDVANAVSWNRVATTPPRERTALLRQRVESLRAFQAAAEAEHAAYVRVEALEPNPVQPHEVSSLSLNRPWHPYGLDLGGDDEFHLLMVELAELEWPNVPAETTAGLSYAIVKAKGLRAG